MSRTSAVTARASRAAADLRRRVTRSGSAKPALGVLGVDRRSSTWTADLADRHATYRAAIEPVDARVAIVCVTQRPHLVGRLVDNVLRQRWADLELLVVTNAPGFGDVSERLAPVRDRGVATRTFEEPPERSLGSCLNLGLDHTDARFVAKFDDDDRYGAEYLADALRAHAYAGAGVVGKHTYYAHLAATDETVLRFPRHEFRYSGTLAGGTLVIDRDRTGDLRFADRSLGEDRAFLAACHRRGISTFSADRFNFLQHRGGDNTWSVPDADFVVGAEPVGGGPMTEEVDR